MALGIANAVISEFVVILLALLILYLIFKLGKALIGVIANIVLGFISIFVLNSLFGIGIPFDWIVIIITAVLGLPGVAIIVILRLFGIAL